MQRLDQCTYQEFFDGRRVSRLPAWRIGIGRLRNQNTSSNTSPDGRDARSRDFFVKAVSPPGTPEPESIGRPACTSKQPSQSGCGVEITGCCRKTKQGQFLADELGWWKGCRVWKTILAVRDTEYMALQIIATSAGNFGAAT